jgi:hypothetical protein
MLRQQEYEHRMAHHSGSRTDLLDHDHTAAIYEHGLGTYQAPNNQPYTFVRMCDGKFVRTTIPIHDFEALDSTIAAAPTAASAANYYRSSVNHTLRRPSKRHVVASSQAAADYACCPRDDLAASNASAAAVRSTQGYATLRGRKWVDKQRDACSNGGVGDNFGRSVYMDDSRSMNSFNDDLALSVPPRGMHGGGVPMNVLMTSAMSRNTMSRSTDRNLDNLGLSDDDLLIGSSNRTSAEEMLTLLTREPPDGKEKPEPSKSTLLKMETLSRKSSKCDLLSSNSSSNSPQLIQQSQQGQQQQQLQQQQQQQQQDSRSEATSVCGDNSSVLSGYSGAIHPQQGVKNDSICKRDSLSGSIITKDSNSLYIDGSSLQLPPQQPQDDHENEW